MEDLNQVLFQIEAAGLARATVAAILQDAVVVTGRGSEPRMCDVLECVATGSLAEGDVVLTWFPNSEERGIVLGRVRTSPRRAADEVDTGDLVLEAKHSLTLRVGSGSITIREDGKILIKGKDLVSHAQRLNRIKGGAVQIN